MTTCERLLAASLVGVALSLATASSHAQSGDQTAARALFAEARKLMKAGSYDAACPKLEAAAKLYAGSGVLLNLADCYEHTGRTASAWNEFGAAAEAAVRAGRSDDEAEAKRRQEALVSRLSHLVVHIAKETPGLVVTRDGTDLDKGAWETAIPIDPGTYSLEAHAPGRTPWSGTVTVHGDGDTVTAAVPALAREGGPSVEPPSDVHTGPLLKRETPRPDVEEKHGFWNGGRVTAATVAGLGIAGLCAGGAMGFVAKGQFDTAQGEAGAAQRNDSANAVRTGNLATGLVIGGAAAVGAGIVVWLVAPSPQARVGTNGREVFLGGTF
jgi:serine/threonine-protein kinase